MQTLLLDQSAWDLVTDAFGNIALASNPYSLAQDAASEIRLFLGEAYYDTTRGIPYWQEILAQDPPISLMKAKFNSAAELTPEVVTAQTFITSVANRQVNGQVQILDDSGAVIAASFF
jgi:hypothetical protein